MRRRQLLAISGSALFVSGCLGQAKDGDGESPTVTPTSSRSSSCPPFPGERDGQTICDGKERDAPIYLLAKNDTVSATEGTIDFAFVNAADDAVAYGPCFWTLYKKSQSGWEMVHPIEGNAVGQVLPAQTSHELTLRVGQNDDTSTECNPYSVTELETGRHLFGIQGETPDGTTTLFLASFRATQ